MCSVPIRLSGMHANLAETLVVELRSLAAVQVAADQADFSKIAQKGINDVNESTVGCKQPSRSIPQSRHYHRLSISWQVILVGCLYTDATRAMVENVVQCFYQIVAELFRCGRHSAARDLGPPQSCPRILHS